MNWTDFFIRRPVTTVILNLALIVAGIIAWWYIPIAALPRFDIPTISVSANLTGASPETMANTVALPLEKQFATIAGLSAISSSSSLGRTSITLEFDPARDIDRAAADVQAALLRAQRSLPSEASTPTYRKFNPADAPILLLALTAPGLNLTQLNEYAENIIAPTFSTINGVAQVSIFGQKRYAIRITVDPQQLAVHDLTFDELNSALDAATSILPLGTIDGPQQTLIVQANSQLKTAQDFAQLILAQRNNNSVRLSDVAQVKDSIETPKSIATLDQTTAIVLAVQRQPDANTVAVVDAVLKLLPTLAQQLPRSIRLTPINDRAAPIRESLHDVYLTLSFTIGLVLLIIAIFLKRVWATAIPAFSVPLSLLGAIAVLYYLGYSLDNISLLGLTLAVGLVVDDAIIMLENIIRQIDAGISPFRAAIKGAREMSFTIISISLSLIAVLLPIFTLPGVVGLLFQEFAVAVGIAILISAFVSLTLVPMLSAHLLRPKGLASAKTRATLTPSLVTPKPSIGSQVAQTLEHQFDAVLQGYLRTLKVILRYPKTTWAFVLASCIATLLLALTIPKGFFPEEDIGQIRGSIEAAEDISFDAMQSLHQQVVTQIESHPAIERVVASLNNTSGSIFINLKSRQERAPIAQVIADLQRQSAMLAGVRVSFRAVQNLSVGGRNTRSRFQYVLRSVDDTQLQQWAATGLNRLRPRNDLFSNVTSDAQNNALYANVDIDFQRANNLGVTHQAIRNSLYNALGERQANPLYLGSNSYAVIVESNPAQRQFETAIQNLNVRSKTGALIPLSEFITVARKTGRSTVNHVGQLNAITLSFDLAPNAQIGPTINEVERLMRDLPPQVTANWAGDAAAFTQTQSNQWLLLLGALIVIYALLAMLYESFIHPLTILLGLPSAMMGALLALWGLNFDLSLIAVIGILMLLGIVKKNAIMLIDYALSAQREAGLSPQEAIIQACQLRFRPIMMTTLVAFFGVLPIALGIGAGAELRQPLGVAVAGGLLLSQIVTLLATPVIYLTLDRYTRHGVVDDSR